MRAGTLRLRKGAGVDLIFPHLRCEIIHLSAMHLLVLPFGIKTIESRRFGIICSRSGS